VTALAAQLGLPLVTARYDRLCAVLPISPGELRADGSIVSLWLAGAAAEHGDRFPAWTVRPLPEGCLAWREGCRWAWGVQTRTITAVGSGGSGGPFRGDPGDRHAAAEFAQEHLLLLDQAWRRARELERSWGRTYHDEASE
jgi:hypothetical protein